MLRQPLEQNLRRALLFSNGDPGTFLTHLVSATLLATARRLLSAVPYHGRVRRVVVSSGQRTVTGGVRKVADRRRRNRDAVGVDGNH